MSSSSTVWVMAGGTGGHIVPGLAVAETLRDQGYQVRWVGNPERMEGRLVPAAGFEMISTRFSGVRGKGIVQKLKAPLLLVISVLGLLRTMLQSRPAVVLGMGGYVSVPGAIAAWLARVPVVLHEQNAIVGMSNQWLARVASRVLTGFPDVLPGGIWVGNPVRRSMQQMGNPRERYASRQGSLRLLVVGGSLGALALNQVVPEALGRIPQGARPVVVHQSGQSHIEGLREAYRHHGVEADCVAFIDDMASEMAQADLMICRAGAMTVSEVAAAGVAALFVPFPFAVDDHQTANANYLVRHEAAFLRQQSELAIDWLAQWIAAQNRQDLGGYAERAQKYARLDAAAEIARHCLDCMRKST